MAVFFFLGGFMSLGNVIGKSELDYVTAYNFHSRNFTD